MRYYVEVGGREHEVSITQRPDGALDATVNGRAVALEAVAITARELTVRVDGRVADLTTEGAPPQLGVVGGGLRGTVRVESERLRAAGGAAAAGGGARERDVRSPMPGRVVKMLVAVGDEVAAGQPVAIIEAMKMENEVRARKGGTVTKVAVAAGATVEASAVLVAFT